MMQSALLKVLMGIYCVDEIDILVIGAGVVGLACARELALAGHDVIVVEQVSTIGWETSSRNSEVIHSGIYYPTGSLKAKACLRGRELLYAYCDARHIPYRKLGKLIVATTANETLEIERLLHKGLENGVSDLELISAKTISEMEPHVRAEMALWSPSTGIIDSHSFMLSLQGEIEDCGGLIAFNTPVLDGEVGSDSVTLNTGGLEPMTIRARHVINCAGLHAQSVAKSIQGMDKSKIPESYLARGVYFSLAGKSPFTHLIYPAPEAGGLGVHATLDLAGQCRFGPDVEWIDGIDYTVAPERATAFYDRIRSYWPALEDGQLIPGYAGIRPKIVPAGAPAGDFIIQHDAPGLINLFGIESPGLTASLAIAEHVAAMVGEPAH